MANIIYCNFAVKAATENVLDFVNEGLRNLGLETKDNIKDAIECLWNGKNDVVMSTFCPIRDVSEMDAEVELTSYSTDVAKGVTIIYMWERTRRNIPYRWLKSIKGKFNLNVFIFAHEQMNNYHAYGEIDSVDYDYAENYFREHKPKPDDFNDSDDFNEAWCKFINELISELHDRFEECVEGRVSGKSSRKVLYTNLKKVVQ